MYILLIYILLRISKIIIILYMHFPFNEFMNLVFIYGDSTHFGIVLGHGPTHFGITIYQVFIYGDSTLR